MTPEQRAKIQALRKGEKYIPPVEPIRLIPKSVQVLRQHVNFKKLFEQRKSK